MRSFRLIATAALVLSLSACVGITLNPQERSLSRAVDDINTQAELNARLIGESGSLFANVNSTVIEGRVHLSGTVATHEERITVTRLAWATPNVREVVNDIEVTGEAGIGDIAEDLWISAQVRAKILTDRSIRDGNYTIDTQNRVVYQGERDRVLAHARSVPEARHVVNHALLKDDQRRFGKLGRDEEQKAVGE
jgi:osmotically-inducible protein OsmY